MLIDSHCHLSFKDYADTGIEDILKHAQESGVTQMITIGAGEGFEGNQKAIQLAQQYPEIYCTVGIHPHDAKIVTPDIVCQVEELAKNEKVVAIGEIGLDFHYENSPKEVQEKIFDQFVKLAQKIKKPIVIHDRDAGDKTWQILKDNEVKENEVMIHCFTGTMDLAKKYLDLGCYLSFTGIITFKKAQDLREVVKITPLEKLLIETDSPYLAPNPYRGKRNEPAYVKYVAEKVGEIKGVSFEEVAAATTSNAKSFFKLRQLRESRKP